MAKKTLDETIEQKLEELFATLNKNNFDAGDWKFIKDCKHFFDSAILNINEGYFETAFLCFCSIIEGIVNQTRRIEYTNFHNWIISNKNDIDFNNLGDKDKFREELDRLFEEYNRNYGARKNFIGIIFDSYIKSGELPDAIQMKTIKESEDRITQTFRAPEEYKNGEKIIQDFKKDLGKIYDNYRSPITHKAQRLNQFVILNTRVGWETSIDFPSLQLLGTMAIQVMKYNFNLWENNDISKN